MEAKLSRKHAASLNYTYNDGGRQAAGFEGKTGDCTLRAMCILTGADYAEAHRAFSRANREWKEMRGEGITDPEDIFADGTHEKVAAALFPRYGLKQAKTSKDQRLTYTEAYNAFGDCIIFNRHNHTTTVINGTVQDIIDTRQVRIQGGNGHWRNAWENTANAVYVLKTKPVIHPFKTIHELLQSAISEIKKRLPGNGHGNSRP